MRSNNAEAPACKRGVTCIFAAPDRPSTAIDAQDLAGVNLNASHELTFGDHDSHPKRHFYQVYHVQTHPM
jgi:hypothetical protein